MRYLTLLSLLFLLQTSQAQEEITYFEKGQKFAGGNLQLSINMDYQLGFRFSNFRWLTNLNGHHFVTDKQTAGLLLNFQGFMLDATGINRFYSLGFGLGTRRYFAPNTSDLNFFGEFNAILGTRFSGVFARTDYYQFELFAGPSYFINEHWNVEGKLGIRSGKSGNNWTHQIPLQFGFHYFF